MGTAVLMLARKVIYYTKLCVHQLQLCLAVSNGPSACMQTFSMSKSSNGVQFTSDIQLALSARRFTGWAWRLAMCLAMQN